MNATNNTGLGWRLSIAACALALFTAGCGSDSGAPADDIGDNVQAPPTVTVPDIPDGADPLRCTDSQAQARAEKMSLCKG